MLFTRVRARWVGFRRSQVDRVLTAGMTGHRADHCSEGVAMRPEYDAAVATSAFAHVLSSPSGALYRGRRELARGLQYRAEPAVLTRAPAASMIASTTKRPLEIRGRLFKLKPSELQFHGQKGPLKSLRMNSSF